MASSAPPPPSRDPWSPDIQESSSNGGRNDVFSTLCYDRDLQSFGILEISRNKVNFWEFLTDYNAIIGAHATKRGNMCDFVCRLL